MKKKVSVLSILVLLFSIFLTSCGTKSMVQETSVGLVNTILKNKGIYNVRCTKVKLKDEYKGDDGIYYYNGTAECTDESILYLIVTYNSKTDYVNVEVTAVE